jgi:KEOPS complex subunit Pcc1
MINAKFIFEFDSNRDAEIIFKSLNPESKNKISDTNITVSLSKKTCYLHIKAKNLSSLRAASNSYLRWINTAFDVIKTI